MNYLEFGLHFSCMDAPFGRKQTSSADGSPVLHNWPVVHSSECCLSFAVPTNEAEYYIQADNPANRDFVPRHCASWTKYYFEFARHIPLVDESLFKRNVRVVRAITLDRLAALFDTYRVIILFAHWNERSVEMADGLVSIPDLVHAVPPQFTGMFDLCVCHPIELVLALKRNRPNCVVKFTNRPATASTWLWFYEIVFRVLERGDRSYSNALEEAARLMTLEIVEP
jgi:hypothetical protein